MQDLIDHIHHRIAERKFATIFKNKIARIYSPIMAADMKMKKAIDDFADQNGWNATISDTGVRVTFRAKNGNGTVRVNGNGNGTMGTNGDADAEPPMRRCRLDCRAPLHVFLIPLTWCCSCVS